MDPETRSFLIRIANTLFMGLFWMMVNSTFGIYFGFAFPDNGFGLENIIYYVFLITSFIGLIWYYRRLWKEKGDINK